MNLTVHPLLVSAALTYVAVIWWITRKSKVRMDTRIFSIVYLGEALIFVIFWVFDVPNTTRAFWVRISLIVISLSQAIPLHVSYVRSRNYDK